eukprot:jgi/Psemu1/29682/gm1.29682_g
MVTRVAKALNNSSPKIINIFKAPKIEGFFTSCNYDTLILAPDPHIHVHESIVTKGHIAQLKSATSKKRVRRKTDMNTAVKDAIKMVTENGDDDDPIVVIELTITHWKFKKTWRPDLFLKINLGETQAYSDKEEGTTATATNPTTANTNIVVDQLADFLQQIVYTRNKNNGTENSNGNSNESIYTALQGEKIIPDIYKGMKQPSKASNEDKDMRLFGVSINNPEEVSSLINGTLHSYKLCRKQMTREIALTNSFKRDKKCKAGHLLQALQTCKREREKERRERSRRNKKERPNWLPALQRHHSLGQERFIERPRRSDHQDSENSINNSIFHSIMISKNDTEELTNTHSISKLLDENKRNLLKYDLLDGNYGRLKTNDDGVLIKYNLVKNYLQVLTAQQRTSPGHSYITNVDKDLYSSTVHSRWMEFEPSEQGGPLFLKLLLDKVSTTGEASLNDLVHILEIYEIKRDCKGENISKVVDIFKAIFNSMKELRQGKGLPEDAVRNLIRVFQTTSVDEFKHAICQAQKSSSTIFSSRALCLTTQAFAMDITKNGEWDEVLQKAPSKSSFVAKAANSSKRLQPVGEGAPTSIPLFRCGTCLNCGKDDHQVKDCPKQKNQARIQRNRESVVGELPISGDLRNHERTTSESLTAFSTPLTKTSGFNCCGIPSEAIIQPSDPRYQRILPQAEQLKPSIVLSYNREASLPLSALESYVSTQANKLPIVIDTGDSNSITPTCADFIRQPSKPDTGTMEGLTGNKAEVIGEGVVSWDIEDYNGIKETLTTEAYFIPKVTIRLFSRQSYIQYQRKTNNVDSNLPIMLTEQGLQPHTFRRKGALVHRASKSDCFQNLFDGFCSFGYLRTFVGLPTKVDTSSTVYKRDNWNLSPAQQELLLWHQRLGHFNLGHVQSLLAKNREDTHENDEGHRHKRKPMRQELEGASSREQLFAGERVSSNLYQSAIRGRLLDTYGKEKSDLQYTGGALFVNHATRLVHHTHQCTMTASETLQSKLEFKRFCCSQGVLVKEYAGDNHPFRSKELTTGCSDKDQSCFYSGVGAHHQNRAERSIQTIFYTAHAALLFHFAINWPQQASADLWPFVVDHAVYLWNNVSRPSTKLAPLDNFTGMQFMNHHHLQRLHVFGCPVYVLDPKLQDGKNVPKWERRSQGVYIGVSHHHSSTIHLVLNPDTGKKVSPQYYVAFDDTFSTVYSNGTFDDDVWDSLVTSNSDKHINSEVVVDATPFARYLLLSF